MKQPPRIGTIGEQAFVVGPDHVIDFADGRMPAVLCTPSLIWFLEHAAREAVLPVLEADESTVGQHIDVDHLAATPLGSSVTCRARVVHVDGAVISLQLEAHDDHEKIARGFHRLRVIHTARFARRVQAKSERSPGGSEKR